MAHHTQLCIVLFGTCLFSILLLLECRKLKGYEFPVYSTKECPGNQAEWKNRSSAINCTEKNGYMCTPNENLTDLLEFCYIYPRILVKEGLCLYLAKRVSRVNSYNCRKFTHGCPELNYFSSETYVHLSCIEIENGCFSAEPSCKRQPVQSKTSIDDTTLAIILGVSIPACLLCILVFYMIRKKYRSSDRRRNIERNNEDMHLLFSQDEPMDYYMYKESPNEIAMFDQWKQDDSYFISTKACKEVEKLIKIRKLVIVAGHSGSGKSAIIQHIALKYREQGWTVIRLTEVNDFRNYFRRLFAGRTLFVFNDPFGKESCDEILINAWQMYVQERKISLIGIKFLMSCRNNIISDTRITHHLVNQTDIVDIDNEKYKLSVDEKHHILTQYNSDRNLSDKDCDKIVQVEKYFPLLCKLYSSNEEYRNKGVEFFTEPVTVLKEEILGVRNKDKGKYCALALLILFNDDLSIKYLYENKDTEEKFKHTLTICGLPDNTTPAAIRDNLDSLKDGLVKTVGDKYHFYHDLVMEITTQVFRTDYPDETIKSADISMLRKRVRIGDCEEHNDSFTIYLSDNYIKKLAERLFTELIGNNFIDVVLNPCMKVKSVIDAFTKLIQMNPEKLQLLLKKKEHKLKMLNSFHRKVKQLYVSKLAFISYEKDITPICALIIFGHTDFLLELFKSTQNFITDSIDSCLFHAVCCNGSMELFHIFSKDEVEKFLESKYNKWGDLSLIHTLNLYHNYEILEELIKLGVKINARDNWNNWTPLLLAVGNDTQKYGDYDHEESGATRRDKTVLFLLSNGADINLCTINGASPLYIACKNGHDSTVQLLLSKKAGINLCKNNGTSPLSTACKKGHYSTVQILLENKADVTLTNANGTSPLYRACEMGHERIVQLLLCYKADINLSKADGSSPLHVACKMGHDSTVRLLLSNKANINSRKRNRATPLSIACTYGHYSTVQLLLSNGAAKNVCAEEGASPLYIACQNGHDDIVQLLLGNGADVNLCTDDENSPLIIGCQTLQDSTVQLLLNNGAIINSCNAYGIGSIHNACQKKLKGTVQLLLSNGADINLCSEDGASPLYIACQNGHDDIVQLLLSNGADNNLCEENGISPLNIACQNGHDDIVQLLLNNGADINSCKEAGRLLRKQT